jgi:hypothetical protein
MYFLYYPLVMIAAIIVYAVMRAGMLTMLDMLRDTLL